MAVKTYRFINLLKEPQTDRPPSFSEKLFHARDYNFLPSAYEVHWPAHKKALLCQNKGVPTAKAPGSAHFCHRKLISANTRRTDGWEGNELLLWLLPGLWQQSDRPHGPGRPRDLFL